MGYRLTPARTAGSWAVLTGGIVAGTIHRDHAERWTIIRALPGVITPPMPFDTSELAVQALLDAIAAKDAADESRDGQFSSLELAVLRFAEKWWPHSAVARAIAIRDELPGVGDAEYQEILRRLADSTFVRTARPALSSWMDAHAAPRTTVWGAA